MVVRGHKFESPRSALEAKEPVPQFSSVNGRVRYLLVKAAKILL